MYTGEYMSSEQNHSAKTKPDNLPPYPTEENIIVPPPEHRDDKHERDDPKRRGLLIKVGAGALVVVVGAGAYLGLRGGNDADNAPRAETTTSAPATPGDKETQNPASVESLDFTLEAEKYSANPKLIMTDFVDKYNAWQNIGYSKKAVGNEERFTMDDDKYAAKLNQASDDEFKHDVLVSSWQSDDSLVEWLEQSKSIHATNTTVALKTEPGYDSRDKKEYKRYIDIDQGSVIVNSNTPSTIVVSAKWTGRDNSNENRGGEIVTGVDPNNEVGGYTLTFVKDGGAMKLASVADYSK